MAQMAVQALPMTTDALTAPNEEPLHDNSRETVLHEIRGEVIKRLEAYTPAKNVVALPADRLLERYRIHCDQPLNDFSYGNVKAYAASDEKGEHGALFALVSSHGRPFRVRAYKALQDFEHANFVKMIASGAARVSAVGENRFVLIYERPEGKPLSRLLAEGNTFTEQMFLETILKPLYGIVSSFEEMGIAHCRIHPDNVFIGAQGVKLGECVAEPSSFSKHFIYEPIERIMANPEGRGAVSTKVDIFDFGVLAVEATHGLERLKKLDKDSYISLMLSQGTYNVLTKAANFSEGFQDFLIGSLSDEPGERWGASQLGTWLKGRRFHLIRPSAPKESKRSYKFNDEEFFTGRSLAHAYYSHWEKARNEVRVEALPKWIDQCLQRKEAAAVLMRTIQTTGGYQTKNQKYNDELLARAISILDPDGPIRLQSIAYNPDVLGLLLSDAVKNGKHTQLSLLLETVDYDLLSFWTDAHQAGVSPEVSDIIWKLQKVRPFIRMPGLGFGVERFLYEFNPYLPCLSSKVEKYHITTLEGMMHCLDNLARENATESSLVDRHIAGFLAAHANLNREVFFKELQYHPTLAKDQEIQMIVLIAKAQEKSKIKSLRGLSHWVAARLLGKLEAIYSYQARRDLAKAVSLAAEEGHVGQTLSAMVYSKILEHDAAGFINAARLFQKNREKIRQLSDHGMIGKGSERIGAQFAMFLGLVLLFVSIYISASKHLF